MITLIIYMLIIRKDIMDNTILKQLLTEYDSKRMHALEDLENRKKTLRESSAEYVQLEKNLQSLSLDSLKSMLSLSSEEKEKKLKSLQEKTDKITNEKAMLLKKLNLPQDYLLPHFDCPLCKDTGYLNNSLCSCIKQKLYDIEYNKSNIGNIRTENFDNFNFDIYSDEPNPSLYHSQFSPRENIKKIYDISQKFVKNFDSPDEKNLMFLGPTGLGKTFLSNCIAKEILDSGKTVLYQTETMNSMKFTELFTIINTRLLNQSAKITKTIISTNLDLKDIFTVYNERIGSRIVGDYNICRFFGDDLRLKK